MLVLQILNKNILNCEKPKKTFLLVLLVISFHLPNCNSYEYYKSSEYLKENQVVLPEDFRYETGILELNYGWQYYPDMLLVELPFSQWSSSLPSGFYYPELEEGCQLKSRNHSNLSKECNNHLLSQSVDKVLNAQYEKIVSSYHEWISDLDPLGNFRGRFGTASYAMDLQLKPGDYGVFEENWAASSSARLWVFEEGKFTLLQTMGYPSYSKETTRPMWSGVNRGFHTQSGKVKLILEVANFHHRSGYLGYSLNLARRELASQFLLNYYVLEAVIFGLIFIVGSYNLIIFFLRPKQKAALFISLFCFMINLRILLVERFFQVAFPWNDSFQWLLKAEYLTFTLSPAFMVFYLYNVFQKTSPKLIMWIPVIYCFAISAFVILTPTEIFSNYLFLAISCIIITILFGIVEIFRNWNSSNIVIRRISQMITFFFLVFSVLAIHDILMSYGIIQSRDLTGYGLSMFTFGQALVLAYINNNEWNKSEKLSEELKIINQNLDRIVLERTQALKRILDSRDQDLMLAHQIQSQMMPQKNPIYDNRLNITTYYKPLDMVGGDYFDIFPIGLEKIRFFLADATGHGVQGGLVTMLIKSEYENIKYLSDSPDYILGLLNQRFMDKFKGMSIYFTCVLVDIDLRKEQILFSGAGHPEQILISKDTLYKLGKTGPLIGLKKDYLYRSLQYPFSTGDKLFLFTDGLFEQSNLKGHLFGEENLLKEFLKWKELIYKEFESNMLGAIQDWRGSLEPTDDVTFIHIQRIE